MALADLPPFPSLHSEISVGTIYRKCAIQEYVYAFFFAPLHAPRLWLIWGSLCPRPLQLGVLLQARAPQGFQVLLAHGVRFCNRGSFRISDDCSLVRPHVSFFCDVNFDPFLIMQDQNKVYGAVEFPIFLRGDGWPTWCYSGFTISLYEYEATIPTLWDAVKGTKEAAN